MTKVKARERYDEAITEHSLEQATVVDKDKRRSSLQATAVEYLEKQEVIFISFADNAGIALPIASFPELAALNSVELASIEVGFGGTALCLDSSDLHVSIAGLISASQSLMGLASTATAARNGRRSSEAKAQAARVNGQKGGRPRKSLSTESALTSTRPNSRQKNKKPDADALYLEQINQIFHQKEPSHTIESQNSGWPFIHFIDGKHSTLKEALFSGERIKKIDEPDFTEYLLSAFKKSLRTTVDAASLRKRNEVAHKWNAPWRSLLLREATAWRIQDLLEQSNILHKNEGLLGARILLRSAFETLAILIYLNQSIRNVINGESDFYAFSSTTKKLLLGSRDGSTSYDSINILTVLRRAERRYPGIEEVYGILSESAHPNHEGLILGYSQPDQTDFVDTFKNRWSDLYDSSHTQTCMLCLNTFSHAYYDEFPNAFEALEKWIAANDNNLKNFKVS